MQKFERFQKQFFFAQKFFAQPIDDLSERSSRDHLGEEEAHKSQSAHFGQHGVHYWQYGFGGVVANVFNNILPSDEEGDYGCHGQDGPEGGIMEVAR